jgi:hypothetical protein
MKPIIYLVALLSLGITPAAWAGAAGEVAAISQQRNPAFEKGDADAFAAAFADNAVYTSSLQPYRIEGKAAITTSAWEALTRLRSANVPEPLIARMMGGNAARQFALQPLRETAAGASVREIAH